MSGENALIVQILIALGTVLSGTVTVHRYLKEAREEREEENTKTLKLALAEMERQVEKLELKIKACSDETENLRNSVDKEFEYVKSTYNSEIRNLGHKIEELREEVRNQPGQLVSLLTKLVSGR